MNKTSIYNVVSVSGRSQSGGDPDNVANKMMSNGWHLKPADSGGASISKKALPMEGFENKLKLELFDVGGTLNGRFFEITGEGMKNHDRGIITKEPSIDAVSGNAIVVMEGNYVKEITFECKPLSLSENIEINLSDEELADLIMRVTCEELKVEEKDVMTFSKEVQGGPVHSAKKAYSLLSKRFKIKGKIAIKRISSSGKNRSSFYRYISFAEAMINSDQDFSSLIEKLENKVRGEIISPPKRVANKVQVKKLITPPETDSEADPTVKDSIIYILGKVGMNPAIIAKNFDIDLEEVYRAIGHVSLYLDTDLKEAQLVQRSIAIISILIQRSIFKLPTK